MLNLSTVLNTKQLRVLLRNDFVISEQSLAETIYQRFISFNITTINCMSKTQTISDYVDVPLVHVL